MSFLVLRCFLTGISLLNFYLIYLILEDEGTTLQRNRGSVNTVCVYIKRPFSTFLLLIIIKWSYGSYFALLLLAGAINILQNKLKKLVGELKKRICIEVGGAKSSYLGSLLYILWDSWPSICVLFEFCFLDPTFEGM